MIRVYLDTSAFFKIFFSDEPGSQAMDRIVLLAEDEKLKIVISDWVINEVAAVIEKKVQKKKVTSKGAHDIWFAIIEFLEKHILKHTLLCYGINEDVVRGSRNFMESIHLVNAADALHVLIADKASCRYFVSADKELNMNIKKSRLAIIPVNPHESNDVNKLIDEINSLYP